MALSADGEFSMLMGDVLTLGDHDLPVNIIRCYNHSSGMMQLEMQVAGMSQFECGLKNPNFAAVAQAVGLFGIRVEDSKEVRDAIVEALQQRRACAGRHHHRQERTGHATASDNSISRRIRAGNDQDCVFESRQ